MRSVWHAPSTVRPRAGARRNLRPVSDPEQAPAFDTGPGPPRGAFLLAYAAVVVAGLFGAAIGYGLVNVGCEGDCTLEKTLGLLIGGVGAAIGVGVVAVLALRAMAEWRRPPHD
jgi:hypothetical protein